MSLLFLALGIVSLAFMIVVHEGGHYVVARWCKMRVDRFSIGFGPGILKRTSKKTGTTFQIAPIPFGGFVEIRGMNIAEEVDPEDVHAYPNRPAWQRFVTIFAGPATNYLSAIAIAFVLFVWHGLDVPRWYVVAGTQTGYDSASKLLPDDRIVAVNGTPVFANEQPSLSERVHSAGGAPLRVTIERKHERQDVTLASKLVNDRAPLLALARQAPTMAPFIEWFSAVAPKPVWRIGIGLKADIVVVDLSTVDSIKYALRYPIAETKQIGAMLYDILFGDEKPDPGGPVRIAEELQKAFSVSAARGFQLLMALSVYLGLFNLLPIPALDGGRLVFLGYELITRRRANPKVEATVHMAGVMVLAVLMLLVLFIDVKRLF